MKKIISICTLAAIVAFGAGYLTCQKVNDVEFLNEANSVKYEILMLQDEALQRVDTIDDIVKKQERARRLPLTILSNMMNTHIICPDSLVRRNSMEKDNLQAQSDM